VYLIWTGNDLGELALLLILTLDNGFNDGRVVAPKVHKDVRDAILPQSLEEGKGGCIAVAPLVAISIATEVRAYTMVATMKPSRRYFSIAIPDVARDRVRNEHKAHSRRQWNGCVPHDGSRVSWVIAPPTRGEGTLWLGKGTWRPRRLSTTDGF
jgi:hypothetical protein